MSDLITKIVLSLQQQQFVSGLRESSRGVQTFSTSSRNELRLLRNEFKNMTGGVLGGFKRELAAIGTTWATINTIKNSAQLDKSLTRMTQTAGVAKKEAAGLRKELFELQRQYGVVVEDSMKANNSLVQSGLNWKESLAATKAIAPATAVTGAQPDVLAGALGVSSEIFGFDLSNVSVATELLDKMTAAGVAGNAELEDLAGIFSRVGGSAKSANMSFEQSLGMIEQLSLREKNPERLATLVDSTLRVFTNGQYRKNVQDKLGINFYNSNGERRESVDVLSDIAAKYKKQKTRYQRDELIEQAFGQTDQDTKKGIQALLSDGSLEDMRNITRNIETAAGTIAAKLPDALNNSIDQTARLKGALREAADGFVQPINAGVSAVIRQLLDAKSDGGWDMSGGELLLGGAGAMLAGGAAYRYGPALLKKALGKSGNLASGLATGKALEEAAGVTPVYVVNMPSQWESSTGLPPAAKMPKGKGLKGMFGKAALPLALAAGGYSLYDTWSGDQSTGEKWVNTAGVAGGLGGGWGGAMAGAAIGTAIFPGVGTAVGGVAGGLAGAILGELSAESIGNAIMRASSNNQKQQPMKMELTLKNEDGRLGVAKLNATGIDMDVTGLTMMRF